MLRITSTLTQFGGFACKHCACTAPLSWGPAGPCTRPARGSDGSPRQALGHGGTGAVGTLGWHMGAHGSKRVKKHRAWVARPTV
eukprot:4851974-Pyramimonas_sp.AAC.2